MNVIFSIITILGCLLKTVKCIFFDQKCREVDHVFHQSLFLANEQCPLLPQNCAFVNQCLIISTLAIGTVKNVYSCSLAGEIFALSNLSHSLYLDDFQANIESHAFLQNKQFIGSLLAYCGANIITQFSPLGNLGRLPKVLQHEWNAMDSCIFRFDLCIHYISILVYLHSHKRVMCDSNSLPKLLEQYLLTEKYSFYLNDMDAVPSLVPSGKIVCGKRILEGEFVAPEQRGSAALVNGYDEKIDIWRIPDVTRWILGDCFGDLGFELFHVHKRCKRNSSKERPSAIEVLEAYRIIRRKLHVND